MIESEYNKQFFNKYLRFETFHDGEDTEPDTLEKRTLRHWKYQLMRRNNPQIYELIEYGYVITKRNYKPKNPLQFLIT